MLWRGWARGGGGKRRIRMLKALKVPNLLSHEHQKIGPGAELGPLGMLFPWAREAAPNRHDASILSIKHRTQWDSETSPKRVKSESCFLLTPFWSIRRPILLILITSFCLEIKVFPQSIFWGQGRCLLPKALVTLLPQHFVKVSVW